MSSALHIFAATDHSPQGNFAVARAFALAALEHSPLQLLQVLNQSLLQRLQELLGQEGDLLQEQLHGDARQRLQTLAEQLDQGQSQRVECHVLHGSVVGSLLEHLQQHPCDLLVLGAQGENALRHLLLGSTAAVSSITAVSLCWSCASPCSVPTSASCWLLISPHGPARRCTWHSAWLQAPS